MLCEQVIPRVAAASVNQQAEEQVRGPVRRVCMFGEGSIDLLLAAEAAPEVGKAAWKEGKWEQVPVPGRAEKASSVVQRSWERERC